MVTPRRRPLQTAPEPQEAPTVPPGAYGPTGPSRPAATPGGARGKRIDAPVCWQCQRVLADFLTTPFSLRCQRCKAQVTG